VAVAVPEHPETRSIRRRRWLILGAILSLLIGLGAAEAAGFSRITAMVATLIQVRTPEGTLIVQVEDPGVSVSIDGDTVVLKGTGVHEVRLRPGKHHVQALEAGRPSLSEWVTITRGDRQVVRVDRKEASHARDVEGPPAQKSTRAVERKPAPTEQKPVDVASAVKVEEESAAPKPFDSADEAYHAGLAFLALHQEARSRGPLERALELAPDDAYRLKVYRALLPAFTQLPDAGKKLDALEFIIRKSGQAAERSLTRRSMLSFVHQRGKEDLLIQRYESKLKEDPDDRTALYILSEAYDVLRPDPRRGALLAERLSKLDQQAGGNVDIQAQARLASQYIKAGKVKEGAELYEKTAALEPKLSAWHFKEAALAWLKVKDNEKAFKAAQASLASPPENRGALLEYFWHRALADVFLDTGHPELAIPQYEIALTKTDIAGYLSDSRAKLDQARSKAGKD
jgi:tetratricopeptide (TPR) repeat protein